MMAICNMCYEDDAPLSAMVETVNTHKMLINLCDECLSVYSKTSDVRLDGHIHGLAIDDFQQQTDEGREIIVSVLNIVGLTIWNWDEWRERELVDDLIDYARRVCSNSEYSIVEGGSRRIRDDLLELLKSAVEKMDDF